MKATLWLFLGVAALAACAPRTTEENPLAGTLLGETYAGPGQQAPRLADGHVSFTGYWKLLRETGKPDGNLAKDRPGFSLPYSEAGRVRLAFNQTRTIDPEARCLITGIPRLLTSVLPFEILHTPQRIGMFYYLSWHRLTWLDGHTLESTAETHYLGNSSGRWDGDALVIESRGFKDSADGQLWLDDNANPQSATSHVVERWTRPDRNHLHVEVSYEDPDYYTETVTYSRNWVLAPRGESLPEFSCEWNTPWVLAHLEAGSGRIGPDGNRGFGPHGEVAPELPLGAVDASRGTAYWLYRKNKPKPSDIPLK